MLIIPIEKLVALIALCILFAYAGVSGELDRMSEQTAWARSIPLLPFVIFRQRILNAARAIADLARLLNERTES